MLYIVFCKWFCKYSVCPSGFSCEKGMPCPCVYEARIAGGDGSRTVLDLEKLKNSGWLIEKKGKSYSFHSPVPERKFFKSSKDVTLYLRDCDQYEATVRCSCGQSNTNTSNCTSKDHRDKIKVPDPVVKDLISSKL